MKGTSPHGSTMRHWQVRHVHLLKNREMNKRRNSDSSEHGSDPRGGPARARARIAHGDDGPHALVGSLPRADLARFTDVEEMEVVEGEQEHPGQEENVAGITEL